MNSAATCLAASIRFGFKSSASILVDTSTASMMSIPSISVFCQLSVVCGRASTSTIITNVKIRSTNGACSKYTFQLRGACMYIRVVDTCMVGSVFLRRITYHTIYGISSNSRNRYSIFAKIIVSTHFKIKKRGR